jgi:hypothetical protein
MLDYHIAIGKIIKTEFEASNIIKHPGRKGSSRNIYYENIYLNYYPQSMG